MIILSLMVIFSLKPLLRGHVGRAMQKRTSEHMRTVNAQTSLRIRAT